MDDLYMIIHDEHGLWYSPPAKSAEQAWNSAIRWNFSIKWEIMSIINEHGSEWKII